MQIFLHRLSGECECVEVSGVACWEELAAMSIAGTRLVCEGSALHTGSELRAFANVYETGSLDGGKKKKKKKVPTTKKKNKHIHKRVKMAIYNLYAVDARGVVTQQRKACPTCSFGTFMGQHWDRYYCGLCHTTIKMDPETIQKNEEVLRNKRALAEAERKAKEKEAAEKAPAGKNKKDTKKAPKKK